MANTYTNLLYHIIFSTKERRPLISKALQDDLYSYMGGIIRAEGGVLLEIGGVSDHIHLVAKLKPDTAVATILRVAKAKSSKWANERGPAGSFRWQTGYGAFTVSESQLPDVRADVQHQEAHHRTMSFQDELLKLLERHGIQYDERYLWG